MGLGSSVGLESSVGFEVSVEGLLPGLHDVAHDDAHDVSNIVQMRSREVSADKRRLKLCCFMMFLLVLRKRVNKMFSDFKKLS